MKITNRLTLSIYCFLFVFAGVIGAYGGLSELLLIAHAQSNDTVEQTETLIYDYPNLGFTLEYPFNWSKQESLSFISPPTSPPTSQSSSSPLAETASNDTISATNLTTESIAATTEVLVSNITLKEYSESVIGFLESQFPDFTLLNSFKTTLSGYPAHQIEYTFALEGSEEESTEMDYC